MCEFFTGALAAGTAASALASAGGATASAATAAGAAASAAATAAAVAKVGIATSLIGAGVSGYSQYQQGKQQDQAAETNAKISSMQAKDAADRGAIEERNVRNNTRALIAQQRVALAANGIDISSGTPLNLQAEAAGLGEVDAVTARTNSLRQAWGFDSEAANLRAKGKSARQAGMVGAAGTLLSGASNAYSTYRKH